MTTLDSDSRRILLQFADMYRSGAQGASMEWEAAQALALSIDDALSSIPEQGVKPLEWKEVQDQIPKHAFAAYTPFGRWLIVCEFLSMNHMVYRFNGIDYSTLGEAKAAAQADYAARILSALVAPSQPAAVAVTDEMVERVSVPYDGFTGYVIGSYTTREGKHGVVVQQDGTRVVHVYGRSRVEAALRSTP